MAHSTQFTIPAMHAHIKATESVILILSLTSDSKTLLPRPHTRDSSGCRHSEHTTHPPAQPPHPHHQIHLQDSRQPSHTRTCSSSTRAQGPARRRTVTIAVTIARSGVAGVSQPIGEPERKRMKREGEGRSTADTARESRQHEEKAAGPAAQFTHHETASTQGGHTTPAATHHAGGEDIHHHLPQLIPAAPGKWQKPRGHHTTHTEQANPHPSITRHKISCHPATNGTRSPTQRSHTRCITPAVK
ncbi:hypothetical protein TcCL_NonESM10332 [Trypanosoma cruzi]|nr:hypothetical protein TcCL_NonESM10332 [Trypanosoma cruzi]